MFDWSAIPAQSTPAGIPFALRLQARISALTADRFAWLPPSATSRRFEGLRRSGVLAVAVLLLSGVSLLAPLVRANPLDAGWTDSLYDDGDYDEIKRVLNISALTDVDGITDTSPDWKLSTPVHNYGDV